MFVLSNVGQPGIGGKMQISQLEGLPTAKPRFVPQIKRPPHCESSSQSPSHGPHGHSMSSQYEALAALAKVAQLLGFSHAS
jgi:hypothetical protein